VQTVIFPNSADFLAAKDVRPEWIVEIIGKVNQRPQNMVNSKIATGAIEIEIQKLAILSKAQTLPITIDTNGYEISEDLRLKYRYLDLRRQRLHHNLIIRHRVINFIRKFLTKEGFVEVETPILTKSTPEGARDFWYLLALNPANFTLCRKAPSNISSY